jgi:hypothetical protein
LQYVVLDSAYKHGITEYAINHCLLNVRNEVILETYPDKILFVGFDHNGNPLEVIGIMEDETLVIIHAMGLREKFYHLLGRPDNG